MTWDVFRKNDRGLVAYCGTVEAETRDAAERAGGAKYPAGDSGLPRVSVIPCGNDPRGPSFQPRLPGMV